MKSRVRVFVVYKQVVAVVITNLNYRTKKKKEDTAARSNKIILSFDDGDVSVNCGRSRGRRQALSTLTRSAMGDRQPFLFSF